LMLGVYLWMFYLAAHSWDVAFLMVWLKWEVKKFDKKIIFRSKEALEKIFRMTKMKIH
jgi:hypothetical protein